ncbi:MAG: hypothetical protein ABI620_00135 [Chloroflexota bacterium]
MAESPVATPHLREEAPSPTRSSAAPEAAAPEAAPEAATQALVRALHPGASGAAGAPGPPPPSGWAARRSAGPRDFVALQRMAGNRAVAGMMARRSTGPAPTPIVATRAQREASAPAAPPAVQRQSARPAPAPVVQRKPKGKVVEAPLDDIQINPPEPPKAYALQYQSNSLDEAAKSLAKDIKHPGDVIIIGLQPKLLIVYGKDGTRISQRFDVKLPAGIKPSPGVYMSPSAKDAEENKRSFPMRQVTVDPTTEDWKLGGYVAFLKQEEKKKADAGDAGGDLKSAPADQGSTGQGPDAATTPGAGDPTKARKPLPLLNLRSYVQNGVLLDAIITTHKDALQFYLVPEPKPGSGGKPGAGSTTGFAGEVAGDGPPPNSPPWPVSMDGPRMQPADSDGAFSARINWAANGNDSFSSQVVSAVGTYIHYRWEMFDITAFAKKNQEKLVAQAAQTKAIIKAADERGIAIDTPGSAAATSGGSQAPGKPGASPGTATPATVPPPTAEEKTYEEEIDDLTRAKAGAGKDTDADTRNRKFRRGFEDLIDDTGRAAKDLANPTGSTMLERQSNAQANLLAIELMPISFVITALGSTLRWFADLFAGEQDNQEINFPHEGTFLVRVITTPSVGTDREGNEVRRPSSVATRVIEVVKMDRMVKEGLDDPAAQLAQAELELAQATKSGNEERIKAAQAARDLKQLETEGDPLKYIEAKLKLKKEDLERVKKKYEGVAVGPILEVEREIDTLENRRQILELQERRRTAGVETVVPARRVNATLVSEVTGQTYPLLLSIGPAKMEGTRHVWKVLDATNEDAEGFTGYGASEWLAVHDAFRQFGNKAAYGRGLIGVRIPDSVPLGKDPIREFTVPSKPLGWAIARGRIDDLVMTLAALGLIVASAGTASIAIGAAVAAARLVERLYNGTLRFDAAAVSDVLAILGAIGAAAHHAAEVSAAAAGVKFQKVGSSMVMLEEGASVTGAEVRAAEQAFEKASGILSKIEKANEVLNYAGVVWGNVTFFNDIAETAELEAKGPANGGITHAEARRRRATGLAGAINNNGMAIAPNAIKAAKARKAARAAAKTGAPSESHPRGGAEPTPKPDTTPVTTEPKAPAPDPKAPTGGDTSAGGETGAGGEHGSKPTEATTKPGEPAVKPGEHAPDAHGGPGSKPGGELGSGAGGVAHAAGGASGEAGPASSKPGPKPGSAQERAAAHKALQEAARGEGDLNAAAENAIGKGGTWKEGLKKALSQLDGDHRVAAEKALVDARERIVNEEWAKLQERYPNLKLENAGTKSFSSDIDATVRPKAEAEGAGPRIAEQVEQAAKAGQELADALRNRVGGETDAVIDTNIYSFIGEGRLASVDPKVKGAQAHVDLVTGLAEQLRGQGEASFKAFEQSLGKKLADPRVGAEAKALLGEAREFHKAREAEWATALKDAQAAHKGEGEAAQTRAAREALLAAKKGDLGKLLAGEPPNPAEIARKQAEINWFAPDAYATPSAFKQAVAHGQRLKGSARTAAEWTGADVAAKLREQAGKLAPDDPRGQKLRRDAGLAESQGNTLEAIQKDIRAAQDNAPVDIAKVKDLEAYADGLRKSLAKAAEPFVIADLLGLTSPADMPGPQRISEAAAASAANLGMLEAHVKHAPDIDARVKAAAKYSGRIAMAEFLGGLRPAVDPVARLINDFVQSRWGILEQASPQIMRDMFVRYARATGRHGDLAYNARGEAVGATDALKQAFVNDVMNWARGTNAELQTSAIGSKAYDNPTITTSAPPATGEPSIKAPGGGAEDATGGTKAGAQGRPTEADGGQQRPGESTPAGPEERPATPAEPRVITGAGGVTGFHETPPLNPPGAHQPFDFRLKSLGEGEATLRRIAAGDALALSEQGVQLPQGYKTQGREFGLARMPDGTYAIIQGDFGKVRWSDLPKGTIPLAHTHPIAPELALARPGTVGELTRAVGKESTGKGSRVEDAVHVFPSAEDVLFCAANGVVNHDVHTGYVHTGDGVLRNPTGAAGEIPVSFNLGEAKHIGNWEGAPIAEASFVAHDAQGNVLYVSRIWAVDLGHGVTRISFEPLVPTDPPNRTTLKPMHDTPSGGAGKGDRPGEQGGESTGQAGAGEQPADAGGTKAPAGPGASKSDAKRATTDAGGTEAIPGGVRVVDDGFATTVSARRDPTALVRIEQDGNSFRLTDIFRRDLPSGSGAALLAEGLKAVKAGPGAELMIHGIVNQPTVDVHKAGGNPAESVLGKTAIRALESIGLTARAMHWEIVRGKLCIVMDLD